MAGFWSGVGDFFMGKPQRFEQVNPYTKSQMGVQNQLENAAQSRGGAFNNASNYYNDLLSNNSSDMEAFAAPEMRRFNEQIIPDLAEQFAGLGAGGSGLSSSGFQNQLGRAGADLSERLAAMRANLRQNAAQGLQNIGTQALNPYMQNINVPAQQGLLQTALPAAISGAATGFTGAWANNMFNSGTKASPGSAQPEQLGWGQAGFYPKQGNYNPYGPG